MILLFLVWLNFILCWHLSISFFLSLLILLVSILRIWVISLLNTLTIILGDFAILFVYRRTCWFCRWFYIVFYLLWRRLIACFHYLILWVINLLPKRSLILILFRILFFVGLLSFEAFRMSRLNLSFKFLFFLRFLQTLYLMRRLGIGWLNALILLCTFSNHIRGLVPINYLLLNMIVSWFCYIFVLWELGHGWYLFL